MEKACFKCGETKPIDEFYRHAAMGDGHLGKCKDCTKRDMRQHRLNNPEVVRAVDRKKSAKPAERARRGNYARKFREQNPHKRAAHVTLGNAIRDGKLSKGACAFCRQTENVEAHHHDYSKPLDVTWLCKPCHRRFHALERMATYRDEVA